MISPATKGGGENRIHLDQSQRNLSSIKERPLSNKLDMAQYCRVPGLALASSLEKVYDLDQS